MEIKNGTFLSSLIVIFLDKSDDEYKKIKPAFDKHGWAFKHDKNIFEDFVDAILLDSWNEKTYGGSGKKIKSTYLKNLKFSKPWWLAGGISIKWINEILTDIKPDGLDISSSIEFSPGLKDIKKTKDLFNFLKKISNY